MAAKANKSGRDSHNQAVLIVKTADIQENLLQCQTCVCRYNKSGRRPKILTCGHVFCLSCLKKIPDQGTGSVRNALKCPSCGNETLITKDITDLTPALHIEEMMDVMATTETLNLCSKHQGQALNFYCLKCSVPVCVNCTLVDHNRSDNHNITDLSEVLDSRIHQFNQIKIESERIRQKLASRSVYLKNALRNLDTIKEIEMKNIDEKFADFTTLVQIRQIELKTGVSETIERLISQTDSQSDDIEEQIKQFQGVYDSYCAVRNSKDINQILTMNEEMTAHKEKFRTEACKDDTELFKSCSVSFDGEGLVSCLNEFGKITVYEDSEITGSKLPGI